MWSASPGWSWQLVHETDRQGLRLLALRFQRWKNGYWNVFRVNFMISNYAKETVLTERLTLLDAGRQSLYSKDRNV